MPENIMQSFFNEFRNKNRWQGKYRTDKISPTWRRSAANFDFWKFCLWFSKHSGNFDKKAAEHEKWTCEPNLGCFLDISPRIIYQRNSQLISPFMLWKLFHCSFSCDNISFFLVLSNCSVSKLVREIVELSFLKKIKFKTSTV